MARFVASESRADRLDAGVQGRPGSAPEKQGRARKARLAAPEKQGRARKARLGGASLSKRAEPA